LTDAFAVRVMSGLVLHTRLLSRHIVYNRRQQNNKENKENTILAR